MRNQKTTMKRARHMGGSAMRPFSLLPGWMAALLTVALVPMIPAQTPPPAPSAGFMSIEIPYGNADPAQVRAILKDIAQPDEKYNVFELRRLVSLTARPSTVDAVRTFLQALAAPPRNVKIEVMSMSLDSHPATTGGVRISGNPIPGRVGMGGSGGIYGPVMPPGGGYVTPYGVVSPSGPGAPGVIRQNTVNGRPVGPMTSGVSGRIVMPRGTVDVNIGGTIQSGFSSGMSNSFVLVASGGQGVLEVAREVPFLDYFSAYSIGANAPFSVQGPGNQIIHVMPGGQFQAPEFHWEKAGTRLLVKPTVSGNLISLEVIPQISAIVMGPPQTFPGQAGPGGIAGAGQFVTYTRLSTKVVVENGATVTIGSFTNAPDDFSRQFFGGGKAGSLTIRATVQ